MYPKISIVTPSFNQGSFIEETITSVLDQKYPNLEYIIIDGGSIDNSVDIIKKYEKHLKYWVSEKDNGQSHAINKGLKRVTGDIFNWLCSDDYYEKESLFKIADTFGDNEDVHVVSGRFRLFNDETGFEEFHNGTTLNSSLFKTLVTSYIQQPSTFFRTGYLLEAGLNDLLHWHMDHDIWVKYLFKHGQEHFRSIDHLIANYRLHATSKSELQSLTSLDKDNKFTIERNSIMFSIAKNADLSNKFEPIKSLTNKLVEGYDIGIELKDKKELAEQTINYYLYLIAKRYYYEVDKKKALYLLRNIDRNFLPDDEKENYSLLKNKSNIEPFLKPLRNIRFLRDIKSIFK